MRNGAREPQKKLSIFYLILLIFLLLVFCISAYMIFNWLNETNKTKKISSDIISEVIDNPQSQELKAEDLTIDFKKLLGINKDVVGWIKIQGTTINYPILKTTNNDYYLHYNILKEPSQNGWIFMDYINNEDFSDNNTVIFGHNRKSVV